MFFTDATPPVAIYLSYENLAANTNVAEFQKDVLLQAARRLFPGTESFYELDTKQATEKKQLSVRCISCGFANDTSLVKVDSVKTRSSDDALEVSFDVSSASGVTSQWRVRLSKPEVRYYIGAVRSLSPSHVIKAEDLQVFACSVDVRCNTTNSFSNRGDAAFKLSDYVNKKLESSVLARGHLSHARVVADIVIRPHQNVTLRYEVAEGLLITTRGRALGTAAKGETVRVEVKGSDEASMQKVKIVEGIATGLGEVQYVR